MKWRLIVSAGSAIVALAAHTAAGVPIIAHAAQQSASTAELRLDRQVLDGFQKQIRRYMKLHAEQARKGTPQRQRSDISENIVSQEALATRIRHARDDAKQGDILTPAIGAVLRRAMNPELRGDAAATTRDSIREDAPTTFELEVNGTYPEGASRSTTPMNVLAILPPLPQGLEYRFVDTHLVLLDVDANIVVDYIRDVMCARC